MASGKATGEQERRLQKIIETRDEDAFRELVNRHMKILTRVARHELDYYVFEGYLHRNDLTPEELVGETLIYAWGHLDQRPSGMSLRGWLLGIEYRMVQKLVEQQRRYRDEKAVSLDAPLPMQPDAQDKQEWFWEWFQPEAELTWEDVVPGEQPIDHEVPLYEMRDTFALEPEARHVLMMHDEFEVPLPEVAFAMNRAVNETAQLVDAARASLRERMATREPSDAVDHPAPPEGSDT